jgi:hypothetical protein
MPFFADTPRRNYHPPNFVSLYYFYKNINGFQPVFSIKTKSGVNIGEEFSTRQVTWISSLKGILGAE